MVIDFIRGSKISSPFSLLKGKKYRGRENLKVSLLQDGYCGQREAVPKGFLAVYVGEGMRRFVIPTGYLYMPDFRELMERVAEEFGFNQEGGLWFPVKEDDFVALLKVLEESSAENTKNKKKRKTKMDSRMRKL